MITTGLQPQLWERYLLSELNAFFHRQLAGKVEAGKVFMEKLASHV